MYHVLGMGKKNLAKVMVWEGVQVTVISLLGGLLGGILFSKAAELVMISMLEGKAGYAFTISTEALLWTLKVFGSIFLLILIKSLLQIFSQNPLNCSEVKLWERNRRKQLAGRDSGCCDTGSCLLSCGIH